MAKKKKLKRAPFRPEEAAYLKRWERSQSAPTVWEKMDQDPVYAKGVEQRLNSGNESLGTTWGRSQGPK